MDSCTASCYHRAGGILKEYSVLDRLKSVFASSDFVPTSAVFPSIDSEKTARDLKLEDHGKSRGLANQPPSEAKDFDHIETGVIERIEELRRKGLENYETNRRVYNERLTRAGQASCLDGP
jgi:hypothetical protein